MRPVFVITVGDVFGISIFCIVVTVAIAIGLNTAWRQYRCKHNEGVNETQACDAICRKCGKNLGFVGTWRERQKESA